MLNRPSTRTTQPAAQMGASASTSSQITASTTPVMSPSCSFRKGSPLRRWRLVCARTRKTSFSSWPSARSRTKHLVGVSVVCSIGDCQGKAGAGWQSPRPGPALARRSTSWLSRGMTTWDYTTTAITHGFMGRKSDELDRQELEAELNRLGAEGFELATVFLDVNLHREKDGHVLVFKRRSG